MLTPSRRHLPAWWRPVAALASVVIVVGAASGAAAGSMPGEPAFALRRGVEELGLLFQSEPAERVETLAARAEQRLEDLQRASLRGTGTEADASGELAATLERLAEEVGRAKSADGARSVGRAEAIASEHETAIARLLPSATGTARKALERAAEQIRRIRASPSPRPR